MKAKLRPEAATMATAHKIAVIFYTMVKNQVEYDETIWVARDAQREKRLEAKLKRQANNWATNLYPSNPRLHNEPVQRAGVPWKTSCRQRNIASLISLARGT
jgi:hypothetical protein